MNSSRWGKHNLITRWIETHVSDRRLFDLFIWGKGAQIVSQKKKKTTDPKNLLFLFDSSPNNKRRSCLLSLHPEGRRWAIMFFRPKETILSLFSLQKMSSPSKPVTAVFTNWWPMGHVREAFTDQQHYNTKNIFDKLKYLLTFLHF